MKNKWCLRQGAMIKTSIAVDPGINTLGFAATDVCEGSQSKLSSWEVIKPRKPAKKSFPQLYPIIEDTVEDALAAMEKYISDPTTTEVILEYSYFQGHFSQGIHLVCSLLMYRLLREVGIASICFHPPGRVARHFLAETLTKTRKKIARKAPVNFVNSSIVIDNNTVELIEPITNSINADNPVKEHSAIACMMLIYNHFDILSSRWNLDWDIPIIEWEDVESISI